MHPNLVHWDDVDELVIDRGPLQGRRRRLGAAAGATRIGLSRYELGPGQRAMPVHVHADIVLALLIMRDVRPALSVLPLPDGRPSMPRPSVRTDGSERERAFSSSSPSRRMLPVPETQFPERRGAAG